MIAFQWLSPELSSRLCLTLLHSLWQGALLALAVWVVERVWSKRTVEWRYGLNVAAIVLSIAALPITFAFVESQAAIEPVEHQPTSVAVARFESGTAPIVGPTSPGEVVVDAPVRALEEPDAATPMASIVTELNPDWDARWTRFAPWIAWVYVGGVCLMLVRLVSSVVRAEKLRTGARPITAGPLVDALEAIVRQWSMRVTPALAVAERIAVPTLVGVLKPTILLPVSAMSGLSTTELRMILAHELAHVRRYDMWVNLVQRLAEVVLFFNPAVWFLSRRTSRLREFCCDEMACRELSNLVQEPRLHYAEALLHVVELAGRTKARQLDLVGQSVKGRSPSELRRRLARLLGEPLREPIRLSRGGALSLSLLTVALVLAPLAKSYSDEAAEGVALSFPDDRAVGVVQSRPADSGGFGQLGGLHDEWKRIGPAQGEVRIPAGHDVQLDISKAGSTDLTFLDGIDPDAIQFLSLLATDVDDQQLAHVGRLTGLRALDLQQTRITDKGFAHLASLKELRTLDLSAFDVHKAGFGVGDGAMAVVSQFPTLESISLRLTKVTDAGMAQLAKARALQHVGIEGTKVTDRGLKHLQGLPKLSYLSLGVYEEGAAITDDGLKTVGQMVQLKNLGLSGTPITDEGLRHLAGLSELEYLDLDNTECTDAGIEHLRPLKKLNRVRLFQSVTDAGAERLSKLTGLKEIIANLEVTDAGVAALAKLPALEELMLSGEQVTDASLAHIARMPALKTLWFQDCAITDKELSHLRGSQTIENLMVAQEGVTTACLADLQTLAKLKVLDLNISRSEDPRKGWRQLRELRQVEDLGLSGAGFGNEDFVHLEGLQQLTSLDLDLEEATSDEAVAHLKPLVRLQNLEIGNSVVSDAGLESLVDMDGLEYLTISCLATDKGLESLKGLGSLRILQLASPNVTKEGLAALERAMPSLQELNHFEYRLSGSSVTASTKDPFWRQGTAEERPAKDALEDKLPPALAVADWTNTDGAELDLASLQGKVVLVDFWGTWCGPCRAQLPKLKELYEKYHDRGLVIVGIHTTSKADELAQFVVDEKLPWPIVVDTEEQTVAGWKVDLYPTYYLIDRSGNLRIAGIFPGQLEQAALALLAEGQENANRPERESRSEQAEDAKTSLAVRVLSADGKPVPHVYINLWREAGAQEKDGVFWEDRANNTRWVRTRSANPNDGRHGWKETEFGFESLEPGRFRVTAVPYRSEDEVPDPTPYGFSEPVVYDGEKPQTVDVRLALGESALTVRVIDQESGEPLSGVGLRLRDASGAPIVHGHGSGNFFERTGENGEVRFGSLKAGNYTVEVFGKHARVNQFVEYAPFASPVEITLAKGEKLQEIAIPPRHLDQAEIDRRFPYSAFGQIVDADGKPLEGVEVRAATGHGTLIGGGSVKTGADGRYKLYFGPGVMMQRSEHAPTGVGVQAAHFFANLPGWDLVGDAKYYELLMSDLTPEQITEQIRKDGEVWGRDNTEDVIFANQPRELNFRMQREAESKEAEVSR